MNKTHPKSIEYLDGFAVHWYTDMLIPSKVLDDTSKQFPDKIILNTESSLGELNSTSL